MSVKNIIAIAVVLVGAAVAGNCYLAQADEWENRVERALERNRVLEAAGEEHRARADSLAVANDSLRAIEARRDTIIRIIREEIEALPPEPEGCRIFTEPRDRLISECELQVATVRERLQARSAEAQELRRAELAARERADSLSAVLADRPSPRPDWLPALSAFAGVCTTGQLCAGAGLSWEVRIF